MQAVFQAAAVHHDFLKQAVSQNVAVQRELLLTFSCLSLRPYTSMLMSAATKQQCHTTYLVSHALPITQLLAAWHPNYGTWTGPSMAGKSPICGLTSCRTAVAQVTCTGTTMTCKRASPTTHLHPFTHLV
jgi:hypothetical protein